MKYFKHNNLPINELITFEDREYRNIQFHSIISDAIAIDGPDESISEWLLRTNATEITEEEYNSYFKVPEEQ